VGGGGHRGFKKRLVEERNALGRLYKPIVASDADLLQYYLEKMWKRMDVFNQIVVSAFDALDDDAQQELDTVTEFFEQKWEEAENYIANGGETNKFADASAVEDL